MFILFHFISLFYFYFLKQTCGESNDEADESKAAFLNAVVCVSTDGPAGSL